MAYVLSSHSPWNMLIGHCRDKRAHECKQDQACVGGSSIYSHLGWGYFHYNRPKQGLTNVIQQETLILGDSVLQ